jgi:hypothetical protein
MLNKKIHFAATPGKSNQAIIRETITDLINLKGITQVVISLTFIDRFDVYYNNKVLSINPGNTLEQINDTAIKSYIKYKTLTNSSKLLLLELFSSLVTLKFFTESLGIKFFVFWGASEIDILNDTEIRNVLLPFKEILKDNSFNLFDFNFCVYSFNEGFYSEENEIFKEHAHPGEEAHKKLAEMIYNRIK